MSGSATGATYRDALERASLACAVVGADGVVRTANPALGRLTGRSADGLTGLPWSLLVHPRDAEAVAAACRAALDGTAAPDAQLLTRFVRPDGTARHVVLSLAPAGDEPGADPVLLWLATDVSDVAVELQRHRLLADNVTDVVALGDNDGVLQWVSPSVTAAMGWSPDDLVGTPFRSLVHPDDMADVAAVQREVLAGRTARAQVRLRTAAGDHRWLGIRVRPVLDDAGTVVGRVAGWWDVHEQQVMLQRLTESEARYRAVLAAELDAHVLLEAVRDEAGDVVDLTYVDVNEPAVAYLRRRPDEVIGAGLLELFPALRSTPLFRGYVHTVETGEPMVLDAVPIRSEVQGSDRYFDLRGVRVGDGLSLVWRDVTDRVTAAAALASSEEHFRLVAENASDVVFQGSRDAVIQWVSPTCVDVLGVGVESLVGRRVSDLLHADDIAAMLEASHRVNAGERVTYRARYGHPERGWRWVEVSAKPVVDEAGEVVSRVASLRDVHDRVLAEQALAASEAQARDLAARFEAARDAALEASLAKTAFLSRMSHELRTPLNAVLGFAQLLDLDPLTVDQREAVTQIRTGGRHLLGLINEILDISRVEAGRLSLSLEAVTVSDAVTEAVDMVRPLAERHGIRLVGPDDAGCDVAVWADRQRTLQILINLLSNAVKYNHRGGSVTVTCSAAGANAIGIHVTDTGPGIAAADQARLFHAFERLGAETRGVEGTGIGLALSRGLAEAMSGRIDVRSAVGEGSTFTLVLPGTEPADRRDAGRPVPVLFRTGDPVRVVYVEDNPANSRLVARIAELRENAIVTVAASGEAGLALTLAEVPDLVLLDLHLPDLPGGEVLRRIRADARTADVPVVVVTADATPAVRRLTAELGATGFIAKPLEVAEVLAWIDDPRRVGRPT